MDKFGIFKLLNSFLDFYGKNSNQGSSPLSSLFKGFSSPKERENVQSAPQNDLKQKKENAPLQQQMLSTMRSHDNFVKRVSEKNKG